MANARWAAVLVPLALACSGGPPLEEELDLPPAEIELIVTNQGATAVTAYAQWRGGSPIRLGEIPGGETRTYTSRVRGSEMRVVFGGFGGRSPGGSRDVPYTLVDAWDTLEWIRRADRSVFYQRLRQTDVGG